jgi:hypothetical protein
VKIYLHSPNTSSWRGAPLSTGTTLPLPLPRNVIAQLVKRLGYGLHDRGSRVRFPAGAGNFSLRRVQNGSGAPSDPMGSGGSFPGDKVAGA